jgi:O-antigen/teichoic acid export membrane protein
MNLKVNVNIKKIKIDKGVIKFSILKFLEIGITALTTLIVARKVGPREMGLSVEILLYITYANYLSLGLNQVIIKNYSRINQNGENDVKNFLTINMQYLILISIVNFVISYFVLGKPFFVFAAIISSSSLLRGFATSYFRVIFKISILNKNNLIYSFFLLLLTLFFVKTWYEYMLVWSISSIISISLYFLDGKKVFSSIMKNLMYIPSKENIIFNFSQGIKLAITSIITTFLLSSDRIVLTQREVPLELKGTYQLSDYISMAVYMVFTTVLFYYYPQLIQRIRENEKFRIVFYRKLQKSLFLLPLFLGIIFIFSRILATLFFDKYFGLEYYVTASSLMKINVVLISILSIFYIGLDKEIMFIKSLIPLMILYISCMIICIFYDNISLITIPILFSILLFFEFMKGMSHIKSLFNTQT